MSGLREFLYGEEEKKEIKYAVSKKFLDENGKPLEWILKVLSRDEVDTIYSESIKKFTIEGENSQFGYVFDSNVYVLKLITKSVVFPNLKDLELQSSYGVSNEEELLKKMVDSPWEYKNLCEFVEEINGEEKSHEEEIKEIKELIYNDPEASYAHYCLHKLNILPSTYLNLPRNERKYINGSIQLKIDLEKEEYEKMKR